VPRLSVSASAHHERRECSTLVIRKVRDRVIGLVLGDDRICRRARIRGVRAAHIIERRSAVLALEFARRLGPATSHEPRLATGSPGLLARRRWAG
jgi:hypothetical protein